MLVARATSVKQDLNSTLPSQAISKVQPSLVDHGSSAGRTQTSRPASTTVTRALSAVTPTDGVIAAEQATPTAGIGSLAGPIEADSRRKLWLATKVAHEELGEKLAMILGCMAAVSVTGLTSGIVAKVLVLVLLEAVSDVSKAAAYSAYRVEIGKVRLNFYAPAVTATVMVGVAAWCTMGGAIRINCLVG